MGTQVRLRLTAYLYMCHNVRIFGLEIEPLPANGETMQRANMISIVFMSVVCEKLKKMCKLTVKVESFHSFYRDWTMPYWILYLTSDRIDLSIIL